MTNVAVVLLGVAAAAAVYDWRRGLYLCILVGFLQDPMRKLLPGQPVAAVVAVAVVFAASLLGLMLRDRGLRIADFLRWNRPLAIPLAVFALLAFLQSIRSLIQYENVVLSGLGLLAYFSPIAAILVFFRRADHFEAIERWLTLYTVATVLLAVTVILQFSGFQAAVLESIGGDTVYGVGGRVQMYCGFMRSSEISAVHVSTGAALLVALLASNPKRGRLLAGVPAILVMVTAILVSGRRKMLVYLALYLVLYFLLIRGSRTRRARRVMLGTILFAVMGGMLALLMSPDSGRSLVPYAARGGSVVSEAVDRLTYMAFWGLRFVYQDSGFAGAGAGTATQGSQYFGGAQEIVRGEAEGGIGRVMAELGVLGVAAFLVLGFKVVVSLARVRRVALRLASPKSPVIVGLALLGPTHALVFAAAQQAYGDPFVLLVLGASVGAALGFPRWAVLTGAFASSGVAADDARATDPRVAREGRA